MVVMGNIAHVANVLNLVKYLHGTMHMGISSSSTRVTKTLGATSGFALLGAFLSDSYITRLKTIHIPHLSFSDAGTDAVSLLIYSYLFADIYPSEKS